MRIDWWTLALQAANFLILVWLLQHFLYRPVLGIIADRQQRAASVLAEADAARTAAEALRDQLAGERAAIAKERDQALEQAHASAKAEALSLVERARADAEKLLAEQRQQLEQERADAALALRQGALELGLATARHLLDDASDASHDAPFVGRILARLGALTKAERQELCDQLLAGAAVQLVTARPLGPAAADAVRQELGQLLGPQAVVQLADDQALIAGAELRLPHTILRASWRDSLGAIEAELNRDGRPQRPT